MKKRQLVISGGALPLSALLLDALLLGAFAACEPYLSLDEALTGKNCAEAEPFCAAGYTCSSENKCVPVGSAETGAPSLRPDPAPGRDGGIGIGAAGAAGAGSTGSEPTPTGGAAGAPGDGAGGTPGSAGEASSGAASGAGGGDEPPPGTPDAGCVPQLLFQDRDGDGFGGDTQADLARGCPPLAGFATQGGDCHDAEPSEQDPAGDVFPGQTRFFGAPYPTPSGPSFDYDCSGSETVDGSNSEFVPAPADCEERQSCGLQIGYRSPADPRTGTGVNPLCGSQDIVVCTGSEATGCSLLQIDGPAFRCR